MASSDIVLPPCPIVPEQTWLGKSLLSRTNDPHYGVAGVDIDSKRMLVHVTSTMIYLHVTTVGEEAAIVIVPLAKVPRPRIGWRSSRHGGCHVAMLVTVTLNMVYVLIVTPPRMPIKRTLCCPDCGGELMCVGFAKTTRQTPVAFDSS